MWEQQKIEADRLQQQGLEQRQANNYQAAIDSWRQALKIYQKIGEHQGEGNTLGNLGLAYHYLINADRVLFYHQQSLDLEEKIGTHQAENQFQSATRAVDYDFGECTSHGKSVVVKVWHMLGSAWDFLTIGLTTMLKRLNYTNQV